MAGLKYLFLTLQGVILKNATWGGTYSSYGVYLVNLIQRQVTIVPYVIFHLLCTYLSILLCGPLTPLTMNSFTT